MLQPFFTSLGRVYNFLISLVVSAILGITTWAFWGLYQEAIAQREFMKEGQPVSLQVEKGDQKQRSWRDILSNCTYLTTTYRGKTYETRFVMDSGYVGTGDRVSLLYHPGYDAFRQPGSGVRVDQSTRKSRLIDWTTIRDFTNENKLLLLCIVLSTASLFMISGVIATLVPVPFLQRIARLVFVSELVIAAVFFTYDTWQYYQYYQALKTNSRPVTVRVLDTDRKLIGRRTSDSWNWYTYEATVQYQQQQRNIPISEDDYDQLKPSDSLNALYSASVNDLMSVNYTPAYSKVLVPLFFWLITFVLVRSNTGQPSKKQRPFSPGNG